MTRLAPLLLTLAACSEPAPVSVPNILVLISDDIGKDRTGAYALQGQTYTPTLDALAEEGMTFHNVYSSPTCSPSRTTLQTGRYGSRTGMGRWIFPDTERWDMHFDEVTIPEMLDEAETTYAKAAVGKWHMVRFTRSDPAMHPLEHGYDYHRGGLANPRDAVQQGNTPRSYYNWEKNVDGQVAWTDTYMTTDTVNEAIGMIEELPEPWFLWVAMNAAHTPLHVPPDDLNPMGVTESSSEQELYDADTLAFDMELQRMLDAIPDDMREDLTIIYLADNGTPSHGIQEPYDASRGKATVYEGGVNVPMIVTGPRVAEPGSSSDALIHFADLFPTIADIAGVDTDTMTVPSGPRRGESLALDGMSFLPLLEDPAASNGRAFLFTEAFHPNGGGPYDYRDRTVRNETYKLGRREVGSEITGEYLYDLTVSPYTEGEPLDPIAFTADEQAAFDALKEEMDRLAADMTFDYE